MLNVEDNDVCIIRVILAGILLEPLQSLWAFCWSVSTNHVQACPFSTPVHGCWKCHTRSEIWSMTTNQTHWTKGISKVSDSTCGYLLYVFLHQIYLQMHCIIKKMSSLSLYGIANMRCRSEKSLVVANAVYSSLQLGVYELFFMSV